MSEQRVLGLHHVTAIASEPQGNIDFYTQILGLRLVKKTVNFDDTSTYHLYYGDEIGNPGTILTFFPFGTGRMGQVGREQTAATAFVIPRESVDYWVDRLEAKGVEIGTREEQFGETVVPFEDPDGQPLELVTGETVIKPWGSGPIPQDHAIRGFHGVSLLSANHEATANVLDVLGYEQVGRTDDRVRYRAPGDRSNIVDLLDRPDASRGWLGAGTVHHIAFRTADEETQEAWQNRLSEMGLRVTPVKDRQYFKSIYFREPGGILFEIATEGPGFDRDEPVEALGSELKLPQWLEDERAHIEATLPDLTVPKEVD